jgi:cysteine desulfurase / selenocysteine lyase
MTYPIDRIRADFPALRLQPYGKTLVYLDNAASAQKPQAVLDRMIRAYETEYANVHRGLHYLANAATEAYEEARETCRAFINAPSVDEVIFTKNATEAYNLVASSLGRHLNIGESDEIILSIMEHHSNIVPWHYWREQKGAVIRWAPVDEDGNFLLDEFEKLITPRTRVISITMMSNALGTIVPVKDRPQAWRHHARRWRTGGGASRHRRAGHRLRLLRHDGPQALRPVRHRRALGPQGAA